MRDLYEILGVQRAADQAGIRKAYKALARKYHPDVSKETDAETRFKEVSAAYEVLSDEQRRAWYDEFGEESLRTGFDADRARQLRAATGGMGGNPFGDSGVSLDELFGSIFGGGGGSPFGGGGRGHVGWEESVTVKRRGPDMETRTEIDLLTAIKGGEVTLHIRRPESCAICQGQGGTGRQVCAACRGKGRVTQGRLGMQAVTLCDECAGSGYTFSQECPACGGGGRVMSAKAQRVRIPAGVQEGQVLRLRGLGGEGRSGGPPGNLLLTVHIRPHPLLRREGADLEFDLPVTLTEALGGARITVPTPDGEINVKIPPGAKNGQRLRLKGRGVAQAKGARGDLYLVLRPVLPEEPTPEALAAAELLDALLPAPPREGLQL
ncbi:MAG: J domain-containing protein [Pseudomonadota bacterium]